MSGADGAALLDDVLCRFFRRAGNELLIAEREPARRIGSLSAQAVVFGDKALQAFGYGLRVQMCLLAGQRHRYAPPQRKVFGPRMKAGGVRFLAIGVEYAFDQLVE